MFGRVRYGSARMDAYASKHGLAHCNLCNVLCVLYNFCSQKTCRRSVSKAPAMAKAYAEVNGKTGRLSTVKNGHIPGVPKKRHPCFNFAITSVNVHRF